jgi:hypothetical protein
MRCRAGTGLPGSDSHSQTWWGLRPSLRSLSTDRLTGPFRRVGRIPPTLLRHDSICGNGSVTLCDGTSATRHRPETAKQAEWRRPQNRKSAAE